MVKVIKKLLYGLGVIILSLIIAGCSFYLFSPQFGAEFYSDQDLQLYSQSKQFNQDHFENQVKTERSIDLSKMWELINEYMQDTPNHAPSKNIDVIKPNPENYLNSSVDPQIIWFGHSAFLLQVEGKNLLFDPMLSMVAAPHPWLGEDRYNAENPIAIDQLPVIDAVFISHDHYDHLDYDSIIKLNNKVKHFYVPLAVGKHLLHWGVNADKITELDWWDTENLAGIKLTFTPARHFSGRKVDENKTLWGGWHLKTERFALYFSGDTGYGPHFKEVRQRLGKVDFALLECGQYHQEWADIHMLPEQTVQAAQELEASIMMPVHWGAFTLSLHRWTDPIERAILAAGKVNQAIIAPQIGEIVKLTGEPKISFPWWLQDN